MQGVTGRHTIFIVGDRQVGKTSVVRRVFGNRDLIFVSSVDGATEYHVYPQGRVFPVKILEIRNPAILIENEIEFDEVRDFAFFCYAIDDPESFRHVADRWVPLFHEQVGEAMAKILIGNKRDLRYNAEVVDNLAERGLQPVSTNQGVELHTRHNTTICLFVESGRDSFPMFDQLTMIVNDTILNF